LGAYGHQVYPFENLVKEIKAPRIIGRNPMFEVWLDYQVISNAYVFKNLNVSSNYHQDLSGVSRFDLLFSIEEEMGRLKITLSYKTVVFDLKNVNVIFNSFIKILEKFNEIKSDYLRTLYLKDNELKIINQNFHKEKYLGNISKLKNLINEK
jgi:hypothetical protein